MSDKLKKSRKNQKAFEAGFSYGQANFNQLQGDHLNKMLEEYRRGIKNAITTKSGHITKQDLATQQGNVAEAHHVGSFNIEAAAKGRMNHHATRDTGVANDPVTDVRVTTENGTHDYQLKFYKTGEKTADALSPPRYDKVGKVVPKDQLNEVKEHAKHRASKNASTRPNVAASDKHTADKASDHISSNDDHNIRSTGLNRKGKGSSEELTKKTVKDGEAPEYSEKARVRSQFAGMQYRNAAKSGALSGASFAAASELYSILSSDQPMTKERCMEAAENIVLSALKGAGRAVAVTGVQHLGQMMVDAAQATAKTTAKAAAGAAAKGAAASSTLGGTIGQQLTKGNIAAATVAIAISLGENLYRFSNGEIDSIEFASSSVGSAIQVVGTTCATGLAAPASAFLGQFIASEVAGVALFGTTLGALGPIALGAVFAIGFSLSVGAYVGHFQKIGSETAIKDIASAAAKLESGQFTLTQYAGVVGTMSECKFGWKDLLPFSGTISVISEYSTRKSQLKAIQSSLADRMDEIDAMEQQQLADMLEQFNYQIHAMDVQYEAAKREVTEQASAQFADMRASLDRHLEINYLMFSPVVKNYKAEISEIRAKKRREDLAQIRLKSYQHELDHLSSLVDQAFSNSPEDLRVKRQLDAALKDRVALVLPATTGFDQAFEFLMKA